MKKQTLSLLTLVCLSLATTARPAAVNYDESKVPPYTLPDPFVCQDGSIVRTPQDWWTKRRPEILHLFETQVYGKAPGRPAHMRFEIREESDQALQGRAIRKQVRIWLDRGPTAPHIDLLLYVPKTASSHRVPVFLGLNFRGNHAICKDPAILPSRVWRRGRFLPTDPKDPEVQAARGSAASRWPVERILARGYALATACYMDLEPDFPEGWRYGVRGYFLQTGWTQQGPDRWGAISAWAWGLSRILDYLEQEPLVDARRVVVLGHSRLGKTALWAGAQDQRFAIVISNDSGCGGAALSRREFGETVARINRSFPHWFCENFKKYGDRVNELPVDQHLLLALVAPRPLYVASASKDLWADPRGEFLSALHASRVYRFLGTCGLPVRTMPPVNYPVAATIGYHLRQGKHDLTLYDWEQYLNFADFHFREKRACVSYPSSFKNSRENKGRTQ